MPSAKRALLACTAASALCLTGTATAATLRGRVVDATKGQALPGATVEVDGKAITAARDGSFTAEGVTAGAHHLRVDYVGFQSLEQDLEASDNPDSVDIALTPIVESGDIVVTGTRLAEARALQTKKVALNTVEALYANDVGKLPDQNVAEAVRRLPGLSVANDQGEGRYVIIRGVNPNLVNVTLNGQTLPAPEPDGRQVKLDDIPSALISAVIVTKSLTPDQDANAIGGEVNIRTLSAFDRNKPLFLDARGAWGRYELDGKHPYEVDGQVGGLFGASRQFGAVLSVNYSKRPIESENFQGSSAFKTVNGISVPDQYGLRDYNLVRKRLGIVGNFDWQPTESVKLFLRTSYSRFTDDESRDQNRVDNLAGLTGMTGNFTGRGAILIRRRNEKDNTRSAELGGAFDLPAGHLDVAGTYTRAVKNDPLRSEFNFRTSSSTAIAGSYDLSGQTPLYTLAAAFNPANFPLNSVNYDHRHAQEDLYQARADYSLPIDIGSGSTFKAGFKYLDRHKTNDRDYAQYSLAKNQVFTAANAAYLGSTDFYDGRYAFGPRIDYDTAQAFATANPAVLTQSASNLNSSRNNSQVNDYDVRERISAGYVMAALQWGGLTVTPGVRVEHTQDRQKAKVLATGSAAIDQDFNSFTRQSYTDFFPGVNLRFAPDPDLVFRAAATTAIGRPNYPDLAPYVAVDTTASPASIALGNPDLKRFKAVNLDASVEYYLPFQGILSAGLFYKHIDNPIYTQGLVGVSGTYGEQAFTNVNVTTPVNADEAVVKGVEVNAQLRFGFLPSPLDGFGISANYSRIGGHASGLGARSGRFPLFLQSKNVATAQLFYEKYGLAARIAYSYRSAYLDTLGGDAKTDQYTDHNGQLDVHVSYQIVPQATIFVDGTNLNDAAWRRYIGDRAQLVERERYDYAVRGGIQLHF